MGTAGWAVPRQQAEQFPGEGPHLFRYAARMNAAEVNTSFYRPHKMAVYARWADSVPPHFCFAVKIPREISHVCKLRGAMAPLDRFLAEIAGLGARLGPLLLQLPPSLAFEEEVAGIFLEGLRARHAGPIVCEPRHVTWFGDAADGLLCALRVGRVIADPPRVDRGRRAGGWRGIIYRRLHGSPRIYYSAYEEQFIAAIAKEILQEADGENWCIFDNTARGEALGDAARLMRRLECP